MEEWKDVDGFPGYQVSNMGRIRSFYKSVGYGGGIKYDYNNPKILSPTIVGKGGHLRVFLYRDGVRVPLLLHRVVARAFVPNPNGDAVVRHIDDDPSNNCADNLLWGTQYDNIHDCMNNRGMNYSGMMSYNEKRKTPIKARNLETGEVYIFESQSEAARSLGLKQGSIWNATNAKRPFAGYLFELLGGTI